MSAVPPSSYRERPLIVVAEDGVEARTMLGLVLEFRGYDVVLAVDGIDALDAVLARRPDGSCRT